MKTPMIMMAMILMAACFIPASTVLAEDSDAMQRVEQTPNPTETEEPLERGKTPISDHPNEWFITLYHFRRDLHNLSIKVNTCEGGLIWTSEYFLIWLETLVDSALGNTVEELKPGSRLEGVHRILRESKSLQDGTVCIEEDDPSKILRIVYDLGYAILREAGVWPRPIITEADLERERRQH